MLNGFPYWIDKAPTVEQRGNVFAVTFTAADAQTTLILTAEALALFSTRARKAVEKRAAATAEVLPFKTPRRKGKTG